MIMQLESVETPEVDDKFAQKLGLKDKQSCLPAYAEGKSRIVDANTQKKRGGNLGPWLIKFHLKSLGVCRSRRSIRRFKVLVNKKICGN